MNLVAAQDEFAHGQWENAVMYCDFLIGRFPDSGSVEAATALRRDAVTAAAHEKAECEQRCSACAAPAADHCVGASPRILSVSPTQGVRTADIDVRIETADLSPTPKSRAFLGDDEVVVTGVHGDTLDVRIPADTSTGCDVAVAVETTVGKRYLAAGFHFACDSDSN